MPPMPYNLEKGPYLSMFEDLVNQSPDRMLQCLDYLRDPDHLVAGILHAFPAPIPAGQYPDTQTLAGHINSDWFGLRPNRKLPEGFDNEQDPWDPETNRTTGFWDYWYGDSQAIVRAGLIRALETALGLDHGEELDPAALPGRRCWTVSFFTICGIRWFETWVNWRKTGEDPTDGMVTVVLLTPSHGAASQPSLLRRVSLEKPGGPPYAVNPPGAAGDQGLWVVGALYEEHKNPPPATDSRWSALGEFAPPALGPTYVAAGDVVVVAPPESQGGVLATGRPYQEETHG